MTDNNYACAFLVAFLQGQHPEHRGSSSLEELGPVERWFATILGLPRLKQRIQCVLAVRTFDDTAHLVSLSTPFSWRCQLQEASAKLSLPMTGMAAS